MPWPDLEAAAAELGAAAEDQRRRRLGEGGAERLGLKP
jgi:hypothetical protein